MATLSTIIVGIDSQKTMDALPCVMEPLFIRYPPRGEICYAGVRVPTPCHSNERDAIYVGLVALNQPRQHLASFDIAVVAIVVAGTISKPWWARKKPNQERPLPSDYCPGEELYLLPWCAQPTKPPPAGRFWKIYKWAEQPIGCFMSDSIVEVYSPAEVNGFTKNR